MQTKNYPIGQNSTGALYGASAPQAWRRFVTKYFVFSGRASRSEFWWWMLGFVVLSIGLSLINKVLAGPAPTTADGGAILRYTVQTSVLSTGWTLVNFVGAASLTVRRLHDTGRSGWWWFIQLVPVIGSVTMIIFVLLPSAPAPPVDRSEAPSIATPNLTNTSLTKTSLTNTSPTNTNRGNTRLTN